MLLNKEPFVADSGDCQRICGGEKGSQLVSGNSWIVKGVIFCGVSATDWKVSTCTTSEEIVFCRHGNKKKMQATPKPSKKNIVLVKVCLPMRLFSCISATAAYFGTLLYVIETIGL